VLVRSSKDSRDRGLKDPSGKPEDKSVTSIVIPEAARDKVWLNSLEVKTGFMVRYSRTLETLNPRTLWF
jgi:hypothetical protein